MTNFLFAFNALAPLLLLALLGYWLRKKAVVSEGFIHSLHTYVFTIALPVLIVLAIANMPDVALLEWNVVWFSLVMLVVITVVGYLILKLMKIENEHKPVLLQGIFRGNYVLIGIPLALRLGGEEALAMMIILNVFLITLNNIFSIATFQFYQTDRDVPKEQMKNLVLSTLKNPLMLAVFIGFTISLMPSVWDSIGTHFSVLPDAMHMVAITATPMALIAIGGQFKFERIQAYKKSLVFGVLGRLVAVPSIVFLCAYLLRNTIDFSTSWAAVIAIFATPVAVSSVAITKGLKGDEELASQLVIWTTGFAIVSLFAIVVIFHSLALL